MKLPLISLLALVCLPVASGLGLTRIAGHLDQDPVYSVAAIRAQLARQPQAWVGQTVVVRAVVALHDLAHHVVGEPMRRRARLLHQARRAAPLAGRLLPPALERDGIRCRMLVCW